ncbi:MAG: hypothetical protein ACRD2A_24905, partial [Vicinamibacterales bacterium]
MTLYAAFASLAWNVAAFAGLAAVAAAALFGVIPALRASRPGLMELLRQAGRGTTESSSRWVRDGVVLA